MWRHAKAPTPRGAADNYASTSFAPMAAKIPLILPASCVIAKDARDRDQGRQKRVLDQVLALFLTNETNEQVLHYYSPCAGLLNCAGTARAEARQCRQRMSANSLNISVMRLLAHQ